MNINQKYISNQQQRTIALLMRIHKAGLHGITIGELAKHSDESLAQVIKDMHNFMYAGVVEYLAMSERYASSPLWWDSYFTAAQQLGMQVESRTIQLSHLIHE